MEHARVPDVLDLLGVICVRVPKDGEMRKGRGEISEQDEKVEERENRGKALRKI